MADHIRQDHPRRNEGNTDGRRQVPGAGVVLSMGDSLEYGCNIEKGSALE